MAGVRDEGSGEELRSGRRRPQAVGYSAAMAPAGSFSPVSLACPSSPDRNSGSKAVLSYR